MIEMLLIYKFNWLPPEEFTPGLDQRINDAFRKAYLKDTGGESSYDAWWKSGLQNGWNATLEFVKALGLKPVGSSVPPLETCMDKASQEELDALWNWYLEKKESKTKSAPESTNALSPLPPVTESDLI